MRKLKIFEHISLDGVIQSPPMRKFPHSDWISALSDPRWQRSTPRDVWREIRSASWPTDLRWLFGLLAEGAEQSNS